MLNIKEASKVKYNTYRFDHIKDPIVNLIFPIEGDIIPYYHGYELYSALSKYIIGLHNANWLSINSIIGQRYDNDHIKLNAKSLLLFRLPVSFLSILFELINKEFVLYKDNQEYLIRLKQPIIKQLTASKTLYSNFITFKIHNRNYNNEIDRMTYLLPSSINKDNFTACLYHRLFDHNIKAVAQVDNHRHYMIIREGVAVGYPVTLSELTSEESISIQILGLGGRRHMGCGILQPVD